MELKFALKTIFKDRRFKYLMEEKDEEKKFMESLDAIDFTHIKTDEVNSKLLQKTAKEFVKKKEIKMNIRISSSELDKIKARAEKEGLRYQTFIKSILHKYITNQLVENKGQFQ